MSFSAADLLQAPDGLRRVAHDRQRDVAVLVIESPGEALLIEKLKTPLAVLRQARFGRSSETIDRGFAAPRQLLNERIGRHAGRQLLASAAAISKGSGSNNGAGG